MGGWWGGLYSGKARGGEGRLYGRSLNLGLPLGLSIADWTGSCSGRSEDKGGDGNQGEGG